MRQLKRKWGSRQVFISYGGGSDKWDRSGQGRKWKWRAEWH